MRYREFYYRFLSEADRCPTTQTIPVNSINAARTMAGGLVRVTIRSTRDGFSKDLTCLTIPTITDSIPSEVFPRDSIKIPANIKLADPNFHLPSSVDLLIGSGATLSLFSVGQINLSYGNHDLYLQKTRLGWVIAGSTSLRVRSKISSCYLTNLENLLNKFWTIEELPAVKPKSREEIECETFFTKNISRNDDGHYVVRLPFRDSDKKLGESRSMKIDGI